MSSFFFFNDTATPEIYTLSLHDALPIYFTASHNPAQYHGLKFSSSDAGPALPEVTKDIEVRAAKMIANDALASATRTASGHGSKDGKGETVNLRDAYLKRIAELVRFDVLR